MTSPFSHRAAMQMEAMEVDSPVEGDSRPPGGGSGQPEVAVAGGAEDANVPQVISDSGSSTEVDEDDDDDDDDSEGRAVARVPPRLPATWAFSQRAVGRTAAAPSAAQGVPIRRRVRYPELFHREDLVFSFMCFTLMLLMQSLWKSLITY